MKLFLSLLAMLFAAQFSYAQFLPMTGSPGNYYYNGGAIFIGPNYDTGNKFYVGGSGAVVNFSNMEDSDLGFLISAPFATDKYAMIAPSTATNLAFGVASVEKMRITNAGKVGIGTTTPQTSLHVVGTGVTLNTYGSYTGGGLIIQANTGGRTTTSGAQLEFALPANTGGDNLYGQGRIITVAGNTNNADATGKMIIGTRRYYNKAGTASNWYYGDDLTIDGNGFIGINTTTPKEALSVNGNIRAKQVKVETANFPDYVFKKEYALPKLSAVASFIQKNQHLPEMPSAAEVEKDGINLGEVNTILVKKVEELTLYLIEQKKQLQAQQKIATQQQQQINALTKLLQSAKIIKPSPSSHE